MCQWGHCAKMLWNQQEPKCGHWRCSSGRLCSNFWAFWLHVHRSLWPDYLFEKLAFCFIQMCLCSADIDERHSIECFSESNVGLWRILTHVFQFSQKQLPRKPFTQTIAFNMKKNMRRWGHISFLFVYVLFFGSRQDCNNFCF